MLRIMINNTRIKANLETNLETNLRRIKTNFTNG
jgi:hypothetical protein